jgi:hypothetical protein
VEAPLPITAVRAATLRGLSLVPEEEAVAERALPSKSRAATPAEAAEGLRAVDAHRATAEILTAADLSRGHGPPETWRLVAYVAMCERTGSSVRLGLEARFALLEPNGAILILGQNADSSRVFVDFEAPSAGTYACTARAQRPAPTSIGPFGFGIDSTLLGDVEIAPEAPTNYTFAVQLSEGVHEFWISTTQLSLLFFSLTVLHIPEAHP